MNSDIKNDVVPIQKTPDDERILRLDKLFQQEFSCIPAYYVRVPGRVNIIGEHIDYCGYPVLPMAIEQDILIAVGVTENQELQLRNVNDKYEKFSLIIQSNENINIKSNSNGKPYWYNYVLCGIKGALEYLNNKIKYGVQLYVDGNIPPASGLSSSSALVSSACLAFLHAQKVNLTKSEIATLCANCERYIGTQGGGMDQAIAFLAEKYCAQYITWKPLTATSVNLPKNTVFVVAHSLAEANKAATNDFNRRVMECRLAAKILLASSGAKCDQNIVTLSQVQEILNKTLEEMVDFVAKHLPKEIYEKSEICKILNVGEDLLNEYYLSPNTKYITEFKLRQRAQHVYQEAIRVESFRKTCSESLTNGNKLTNGTNGSAIKENGYEKDLISILGQLMSESHKSLRNLYECSHVNLDLLVDISNKMNVHSRLTGAGWGGCIVALCPKSKLNDYIEHLVDNFYVKQCQINRKDAYSYIFATSPHHGAIIYENN